MDKSPEFYLPRTCWRLDGKDLTVSEPLSESRAFEAYVLLGDPGMGKTRAFKHEAEECGGQYVKARDFAALEEDYGGKLLFIDGLDELRAGAREGHPPLDYIRKHLVRLGRPSFRLSCREADWLGDSDRNALARVAPGGHVVALHLEPLSDEDVLSLLAHQPGVTNPTDFLAKARHHRLDDALRNPQTLQLLAKAVGDTATWPATKAEIYEAACRALAREVNVEHLTATRGSRPPIDDLLDAAGFISAVVLPSGQEGIAPAWQIADTNAARLDDLIDPAKLPLADALSSNLFQGPPEEGRSYLHRSVAEYLGARYLAKRIEAAGLPIERILAMCTGEDGGVSPDLRGLCAWLSVRSVIARLAFIDRDPLGVLLYGDVSGFTPDDKRRVFLALYRAAMEYTAFRSEDWTSEPFGLLSTPDMLEFVEGHLNHDAATDGEQAFQDCVLDAVKHGKRMPELAPHLERIARNATYWPSVREAALDAIENVCPSPGNGLKQLLDDIHAGIVEDRDDQLMGTLLEHLYLHRVLPPESILDYLRHPKESNVIGRYHMFWVSELARIAFEEDLPILLRDLQARRTSEEGITESHLAQDMAGELLARALETLGDGVSYDQIYDWLAVGLDKYGNERLDHSDRKKVSNWIEARPDLYKFIVVRSIDECRSGPDVKMHLQLCREHLFDARAPEGIVEWYLNKASEEAHPDVAEHYFRKAVIKLHQRERREVLSPESLDYLDSWVKRFPKFLRWREDATSSPMSDWRRDAAKRQRKRKEEVAQRMETIRADFRRYLPGIRDGTAPTGVMYELSQIYDGRRIEGHGEGPRERLGEFFGGDAELIDAVFVGMPKVLGRTDLPSVDEVIASDLDKKFHYIREPALIGMSMRFEELGAGALDIDSETLEKLCAFRLAQGGNDDPKWFEALAQRAPVLLANVLVVYCSRAINAKREYVPGIYQLAYAGEFGDVAAVAVAPLLNSFPARALKKQLKTCLDPLLKSALLYMNRAEFGALLEKKLALKSLDAAQRVYWFGCGLLIDSERYQETATKFVLGNAVRAEYLADFLTSRQWRDASPLENLTDSAVVNLIAVMAPGASAKFATGARRRNLSDDRSDLARLLFRILERRTGDASLHGLERLIFDPSLASWQLVAKSALHAVRLSRRKASVPVLTPREVSQIIANDSPTNAADLTSIVMDHLRAITRKIRDGSTNDYKQYWNTNGDVPVPKIENECRDALLSQLEERLGRYGIGISSIKEGYTANEQRADMIVSFGGPRGAAIPVEVKRENYRKDKETIWTALESQLQNRYVRLPAAKGHGVYVVFWFGGKDVPPGPSATRPKTSLELEDQLRSVLGPNDTRIQVCVIDCAFPKTP